MATKVTLKMIKCKNVYKQTQYLDCGTHLVGYRCLDPFANIIGCIQFTMRILFFVICAFYLVAVIHNFTK